MARCSEATEGFRLGEVKNVYKHVDEGFISSSDWTGISSLPTPPNLLSSFWAFDKCSIEEPRRVFCTEFENSWEVGG